MKRPIVVAVIGICFGIIMGQYFLFSIVLFYIPIILSVAIYSFFISSQMIFRRHVKLLSFRRYFRYVKLYLTKSVCITFVIFSIISNVMIRFEDQRYQLEYQELAEKEFLTYECLVIGNKKEKEYQDVYEVKVISEGYWKNKKILLSVPKNKKLVLSYGDDIQISGKYQMPEGQRNHGGFDYSLYLKQKKNLGTIRGEKISIVAREKGNPILFRAHQLSEQLKNKIREYLPEETATLFIGLLLGDIRRNRRNNSRRFSKE